MLYVTKPEVDSDFMPNKESPPDYIKRIMDEAGIKHRHVGARARALGHVISDGYVHNLASGTVTNPSVGLIQALAAGLARPEEEVFLVYRGKQLIDEGKYKESVFALLWKQYSKLRKADKERMDVMLEITQHEFTKRLLDSLEAQGDRD